MPIYLNSRVLIPEFNSSPKDDQQLLNVVINLFKLLDWLKPLSPLI